MQKLAKSDGGVFFQNLDRREEPFATRSAIERNAFASGGSLCESHSPLASAECRQLESESLCQSVM